ncbi:unnamed protein product [Microthlaspi erraticum]|uniref:Uncharacterized protein n=1 Tax=Microthlaspi erraticum TaxID=1685480 RepID=A0A6D2JG17_9BRAS|nr:unnamed protein product [Microthlaspi erraticum]
MGGGSILYLGMVIRCLFKDVPVPTHRIGAEGRWSCWFLAVMIFMYCISDNVPRAWLVALLLIIAGISIVQLSWAPAEDFTSNTMDVTMLVGIVFAFLGVIGSTSSWCDFIATLLYFPLVLLIISYIDPREQVLDHDFQPADLV